MYWIKMGMADWLEVTKGAYEQFVNIYAHDDFDPYNSYNEWTGPGGLLGKVTDKKLSEFTLDNQTEFQPFVKLKDGVQR